MESLIVFLGLLGVGSAQLPILFFYTFRINKFRDPVYKILLFFFIEISLINLLSLVSFYVHIIEQNTIIVFHLISQIFILVVFYFYLLQKRLLLYIVLTIIISIALAQFFLISSYNIDGSYFIINLFSNFLFVAMSSFYLINSVISSDNSRINQFPLSHFNNAILIYYSLQFVIASFEYILRYQDNNAIYIVWPINQIIGVSFYTYLVYAIWKMKF